MSKINETFKNYLEIGILTSGKINYLTKKSKKEKEKKTLDMEKDILK